MKALCTKQNLTICLNLSTRIAGGGSTLPILSNLLLKTDKGRLKVSATNLELAVNTWVGGKIEEEGEITVPARLLNDYVSNLLTERITLTGKNHTLYLEGEKAQTHIKGLPAEEFPLIPKCGEEVFARVEAKTFRQGVGEVVFAAAFSETQPEISGISVAFEGKTMTVAATDRYRLAEAEIELVDSAKETRQIIIPHRAISEMGRIIEGGIVEIFLNSGQICVKTETTELISRLIEGQYPDYKQIMPKNFSTEAQTARGGLIQALKGASLFALDNNNVEVELNPGAKKIVIKSSSAQVGDSEIEIESRIDGPKNAITFNYRYLLDYLNSLTDEQVKLLIIDGSSPAVIEPSERKNSRYVVMPIKT